MFLDVGAGLNLPALSMLQRTTATVLLGEDRPGSCVGCSRAYVKLFKKWDARGFDIIGSLYETKIFWL